MSRARTSAILSIIAMSVAVGSAQADPLPRLTRGQGPVATTALNPVTAPTHAMRYRRPVPAPVAEFYTQPVWRSGETIVRIVQEETRERPIRPRSMNAVDPGAPISRTPSGRVVIGPSPGLLVVSPLDLAKGAGARPYAAPEFHIIGAPSSRNMGTAVKLTHGIKPPEALRTGPKVVWLDEAGRTDDDAGGRIKRLR